MKTYEGMFLLDAGQTNFDEATAPIRNVMARNSAEVIVMKKWDERRLAYEIQGRRRGLYVLTYFKADPQAIKTIERDVQLSEDVLRVMILSADHVSSEKMEEPAPAEIEQSGRHDDDSDAKDAAPVKDDADVDEADVDEADDDADQGEASEDKQD